MGDEEGIVAFIIVAAVVVVLIWVLAYNHGKTILARQIANGTHVVEVQKFSDGTREVRIVEVTNDPAN